jgi:predicted ATPase with chaperone activity
MDKSADPVLATPWALRKGDATGKRSLAPEKPKTVAELGLPESLIRDLSLRYMREHSRLTLSGFQRGLKVSFPIADAIFQEFRDQQLIEVKGMEGRDYVFSPTRSAREHAADTLAQCRYAGPAPVPLAQYSRVVRAQRGNLRPTSGQLQNAMSDLVVTPEILDQLGTALCSGKPIFVYGPSGNGKSSVIERLAGLFEDNILVPYCVEVDGKIISVFDPAVHFPIEPDHPDEEVDPRWVRCRRPCVVAGGELTLNELSLRLDQTSGVYGPPMQMKAANGIFLIDDFGRQLVEPQALFNRWIIPLDRRVDHLSLDYGFTFELPFEVTLVFSTNLEPADLVDEAFIRRVPNKIYLAPIDAEVFDEIFAQVVARYGLPVSGQDCASLAALLRDLCRQNGADNLRACYPGDICEIAAATASFERKPFSLSAQYLARAAKLYFMKRGGV